MLTTGKNNNTKFLLGEFPNAAWTEHLKRVSDFLVEGEDVWWTVNDKYIIFKDGDDEDDVQNGKPEMMNHTKHLIHEVSFLPFFKQFFLMSFF